jgi:hypothetical protein
MTRSKLKPPSEEEVEARMRPGAFSHEGFLGPEEKLKDVLETDAKTLQRLKLTYAEIASRLDTLISAAEESPTHKALVANLECQVQIHQGFQICPWAIDPHRAQCDKGLGVSHASVNWVVRDVRANHLMRGPGLAVHLIRDHHFFEGKKSPYRTDPRELAELLGLCK